jgi:ABC-type cobalamin/Fe3+-siderophores transport system ATPase subunit
LVLFLTHDIQEAADCGQVMLLAHRVVAVGPCDEVLTPETLLEAFGIVLTRIALDIAVLGRHPRHRRAAAITSGCSTWIPKRRRLRSGGAT